MTFMTWQPAENVSLKLSCVLVVENNKYVQHLYVSQCINTKRYRLRMLRRKRMYTFVALWRTKSLAKSYYWLCTGLRNRVKDRLTLSLVDNVFDVRLFLTRRRRSRPWLSTVSVFVSSVSSVCASLRVTSPSWRRQSRRSRSVTSRLRLFTF